MNVVWNRLYPASLNYGAAGSIIGHEVSHGIQYWSKTTYNKELPDYLKCLVNQVESITEPQSGLKYKTAKNIANEMLADVAGINASLNALRQTNKNEPKLPGLQQFSREQLFFLEQANAWCANSKDSYIESYLRGRFSWVDHPYNYFRVNVPAMNSPDFAHAFKCKAGSNMNPKNKCSLW